MTLGISLVGIKEEDGMYPVLISGTITDADLGKALSKDGTTANTFKLAAADDAIIGFLESYEDRTVQGEGKVGVMSLRGGYKVARAGTAAAIGDYVVGGTTAGLVQKTTAEKRWLVVDLATVSSVDYLTIIRV